MRRRPHRPEVGRLTREPVGAQAFLGRSPRHPLQGPGALAAAPDEKEPVRTAPLVELDLDRAARAAPDRVEAPEGLAARRLQGRMGLGQSRVAPRPGLRLRPGGADPFVGEVVDALRHWLDPPDALARHRIAPDVTPD